MTGADGGYKGMLGLQLCPGGQPAPVRAGLEARIGSVTWKEQLRAPGLGVGDGGKGFLWGGDPRRHLYILRGEVAPCGAGAGMACPGMSPGSPLTSPRHLPPVNSAEMAPARWEAVGPGGRRRRSHLRGAQGTHCPVERRLPRVQPRLVPLSGVCSGVWTDVHCVQGVGMASTRKSPVWGWCSLRRNRGDKHFVPQEPPAVVRDPSLRTLQC